MKNSKKMAKFTKASLAGLLILFALFSLSVMGCKEKITNTTADWNLIMIESPERTLSAVNGDFPEKITVSITTNKSKTNSDYNYQISGFSGVNNYSSQALIEKANLTVSNIITTMMAGPEKESAIEMEFLKILSAGGEFSLKSSNGLTDLILTNRENNTKLVFREIRLEKTSWDLISYYDENAVVSVSDKLTGVSTIEFGQGGQVSGNAGVNTFASEYTVSENGALTFGNLITTKMMGPEEFMELETKVLNLLAETRYYDVSGKTLTLHGEDGSALLIYKER